MAGFQEASYTVHENDDNAEVCIMLPPTELTINMAYTTRTVTAGEVHNGFNPWEIINQHFFLLEGNSDFEEIQELCIRTFNFLPSDGSRERCFNITLVDNTLYEITESFMVDLNVLDASTSDIRIIPNITEISILDDDGKNLYFGEV